jgi:hypothetical protein
LTLLNVLSKEREDASKVLGSYWKGCMSNEGAISLYLCTVCDYHVLNKWASGGTPSHGMELQEMGLDGQDRRTRNFKSVVSTKKYRIRALGASIYVETT